MKHKKKGRKFGRQTDQRKAFLRSLAVNLVLRGRITTTLARAKELRPYIEKLITKSKKNDLATVRYLAARLPEKTRQKLLKEIGPKFINRQGGYTRIIKKERRQGDQAPAAIIEFVK